MQKRHRIGVVLVFVFLFVPLLPLVVAGCFGPTIPSGSFRCAQDEPQCPTDQICCPDEICRFSCEPDGGNTDVGDMGSDMEKGPPDLQGSPRPAEVSSCADDEVKGADNGSFDTATPIDEAVDTLTGLQICWPDDVDYYSYPLDAGARMRVIVDFAHAVGDLDAVLQSPTGTFLATAQGVVDDEILELSAPTTQAGDYRIAVYGYLGAVNNYSLVIELLP